MSEINFLDTTWVLIAAFMVFIMHLGFAMVESGFTRAKNTGNIIMKNLFTITMGILAFFIIGFTLAFSEGNPFIGGLDNFLLFNIEIHDSNIPGLAFFIFQAMFAATAATIVSGAVAERIKLSAYMIYATILVAIIYSIIVHWVWGGGWLSLMGFTDFAGSTVVHSVGAWAALAAVIVLGPRFGKFKDGIAHAIPGHNIALGAFGALILWFGWYGFNPGSELAADSAIAGIAVTTSLAAAAGGIGALVFTWIKTGRPDLGMTINGILAGLVAITAGCAAISPQLALLTGAVGGILVVLSVDFLERVLKIDDPVGAISVHGAVGVWGTLAVGLFGGADFVAQVIGIVSVFAFVFITSYIVFKTLDMVMGTRVDPEEEIQGLDQMELAVNAYPDFVKRW